MGIRGKFDSSGIGGEVIVFPAVAKVCQQENLEKLPLPPMENLREFYRRNAEAFVRSCTADLGRVECNLLLLEMVRAAGKL
jgi:hypothetical protein